MKRNDSENNEVRKDGESWLGSTTSESCEKGSDVVREQHNGIHIQIDTLIIAPQVSESSKKEECLRDWKAIIANIFFKGLKGKEKDILGNLKDLSKKISGE